MGAVAALPGELTVIDYRSASARTPRNTSSRGLMITSAIVMATLGLALLAALTEVLIVTWPDFGMTMLAVPVALIAMAFLSIASTAARFVKRG